MSESETTIESRAEASEDEAEAVEAAAAQGPFARALENVEIGAEALEAKWSDALGRARGYLDAGPVEAPLTHLRERVEGAFRSAPVTRAQRRGAALLLGLVRPVRSVAERVEASLQAAGEVEAASDEGTPAAA